MPVLVPASMVASTQPKINLLLRFFSSPYSNSHAEYSVTDVWSGKELGRYKGDAAIVSPLRMHASEMYAIKSET